MIRNPQQIFAIFGNSIVVSIMMLGIYWKVCDFPDTSKIDWTNPKSVIAFKPKIERYQTNITGCTLLVCNQLVSSASSNTVL
jgi:hypothetical protein